MNESTSPAGSPPATADTAQHLADLDQKYDDHADALRARAAQMREKIATSAHVPERPVTPT